MTARRPTLARPARASALAAASALTLAVAVAAALLLGGPLAVAAQEGEGPPDKTIRVYADTWEFTPSTIRVPQGTKLTLQFESRGASHSFRIKKGYDIHVKLPEGSKKEFTFVADKAGTFTYFCARPCGDGCPKMYGELIVEPAE